MNEKSMKKKIEDEKSKDEKGWKIKTIHWEKMGKIQRKKIKI